VEYRFRGVLIDDAFPSVFSTQVLAMGDATIYALTGDVTSDGNLFMSSDYGNATITADGSIEVIRGPVGTVTIQGYVRQHVARSIFFNRRYGDDPDRW